MWDPVSEKSRVQSSLSTPDIRKRLQMQIVESHKIMIFGLLALQFFGSRHFMGRVYGDHFELTAVRHFSGPEITGRITQDGIEFQTGISLSVNLALTLMGVFLALGTVMGSILAVFIPRFMPHIVTTWLVVFGFFALAAIVKAICIHLLPAHHKQYKALLETMLNGQSGE